MEALRLLRGDPDVQLLLDMNLPGGHGLALLRPGTECHLCDVIAVTAARDVEVVDRAVASRVALYLPKPFTYAGFRTALDQYAGYRERPASSAGLGQEDPWTRCSGRSASEVAATLGASRVTARRCLEHLGTKSMAERTVRYGGSGRPEVEYLRTGA